MKTPYQRVLKTAMRMPPRHAMLDTHRGSMRLLSISIFLLMLPTLSFSKDYKDIYAGNEVQWELTAAALVEKFDEKLNVLWFGKVEDIKVYSNQDGVTSIEWLCSQYPFVTPSVEALADPLKVKKKPAGYFILSLILPTMTPDEAKENIVNQMKAPTYALVSGFGVYVKNIGIADAVFIKSEKLIFSDEFEVEFQ